MAQDTGIWHQLGALLNPSPAEPTKLASTSTFPSQQRAFRDQPPVLNSPIDARAQDCLENLVNWLQVRTVRVGCSG